MATRALVLGSGGVAGIAWETGLLFGWAEAGLSVRTADKFLGTSAGANVAAQLTSDLSMEELYQRQVDPALQVNELAANANIQQWLADYIGIMQAESSSVEKLQQIGAMALATPTVTESERRAVIVARLPTHHWPKARLEMVAIDAHSGERQIFTQALGVNLVDAVTASCAIPGVWPPVTINGRRYFDGGCYSLANLDLAVGYAKVLVLQPDNPPFPLIESLEDQITFLQQHGAQVEVITPNVAMKEALDKAGGNALDPTLRGVAARIGREQAQDELARAAALWGN